MGVFPFEIIKEILQNMKPPVISVEDDRLFHRFTAFGIINNWWSQPKHYRASIQRRYEIRYHQRYKDLLPLRLVDRCFNEICTPYVFQEMNLSSPFDDLPQEIARMYGRHVRILRISMESYASISASDVQEVGRILSPLRWCPRIQALTLYYHEVIRSDSFFKILEPFLLSSQFTNLTSIGIYSVLIKGRQPDSEATTIINQIHQLANSERAHLLKRLDISVPFLSADELEVIRTKFTHLEQLNIYGILWPYFRTSEPSGSSLLDWSRYAQLTTLRLICHDNWAWSMRLPDIVRTSSSITHLFISDIGKISWKPPPTRSLGWSDHGDGWWNRRKPLAELHIRASLSQTVYHLGTIPASEVWLTLPRFEIQDNPFVSDEEIFPQMRRMTMRDPNRNQVAYSLKNPDVLAYARTMYAKRGIIVESERPATFKEVSDPIFSIHSHKI
ncbi:hypothetical protein CPB86DRAFT_306183 [Serendipita vermifera]|nr:hypothetical protein CPB86DRAFT_306183 [Serendipita vermifera]